MFSPILIAPGVAAVLAMAMVLTPRLSLLGSRRDRRGDVDRRRDRAVLLERARRASPTMSVDRRRHLSCTRPRSRGAEAPTIVVGVLYAIGLIVGACVDGRGDAHADPRGAPPPAPAGVAAPPARAAVGVPRPRRPVSARRPRASRPAARTRAPARRFAAASNRQHPGAAHAATSAAARQIDPVDGDGTRCAERRADDAVARVDVDREHGVLGAAGERDGRTGPVGARAVVEPDRRARSRPIGGTYARRSSRPSAGSAYDVTPGAVAGSSVSAARANIGMNEPTPLPRRDHAERRGDGDRRRGRRR